MNKKSVYKISYGLFVLTASEGDKDNGSFMCGQIGGMVNEIRPCKEVITSMFAQADELLHHRADSLY